MIADINVCLYSKSIDIIDIMKNIIINRRGTEIGKISHLMTLL